jgi:hypothetical protein
MMMRGIFRWLARRQELAAMGLDWARAGERKTLSILMHHHPTTA